MCRKGERVAQCESRKQGGGEIGRGRLGGLFYGGVTELMPS